MLCLVLCIQIFCRPCEHVILLADVSFSFLKIFTLIFVLYVPLVFSQFIIGSFIVWDTSFQTKWTEIFKLKFWPGSGLLSFLGPPSSGSRHSFSCFFLHTILRLRLLMIVQLPPLSVLSSLVAIKASLWLCCVPETTLPPWWVSILTLSSSICNLLRSIS